MTPEQKSLVQDSYRQVAALGDSAGVLFLLLSFIGVSAMVHGAWPATLSALLLAGLFGLVCFGVIARVLRNRRIARGASFVPGVITAAREGEQDRGASVTRIAYAFTGRDNIRIYGDQEVNLGNRPLPTPGTPITARYVDDKTHTIA